MSEPYSINVNGRLMTFAKPEVMGILNVTEESFYSASRLSSPEALAHRAGEMLAAGASILDVGACSTRPGSTPVAPDEEIARLHAALDVLDREYVQGSSGARVCLKT